MKRGYKFLRADIIIQWILMSIYILVGLGALVDREIMIFLLIVQFFLGGWQLLSGVILFALTRHQSRINYLLTVAAYFGLFALGSMLVSQGVIKDTKVLMVISTILVPMAIAIWYFITTQSDYKQIKLLKHPDAPEENSMHDQILDEKIWE